MDDIDNFLKMPIVLFCVVAIFLIVRKYPLIIIAVIIGGSFIIRVMLDQVGGLNRGDFVSAKFLLLAMGIGGFVFIKESLRMRSIFYYLPKTKAWNITLIMIGYFLVSLLYSASPDYGRLKALMFVAVNVLIMACVYNFINSKVDVRRLIILIYLFGLANCIILHSAGLTGEGLYFVIEDENSYLTSVMDFSIPLSRKVGLAIICCLALLQLIGNRIVKIGLIASSLYLFWIMLISGSKGPILSLIVATTIVYIFLIKNLKVRIMFVLLFCGILVFAQFIRLPEKLVEKRYTNIYQKSVVHSQRRRLINRAIDRGLLSPIIGMGFGGFSETYSEYPHNILAEFFSELGFLGLFLFFLFIYITIREYFLCKRLIPAEQTEWHCLMNWGLTVFIYYLVNAQFSFSIPKNEAIWFASAMIFQISILLNRQIGKESSKEQIPLHAI